MTRARHTFRAIGPEGAPPVKAGGIMVNQHAEETNKSPTTFGRRKVAPRVCVAETKPHIRKFLRETLEEFGFISCECSQIGDLDAVLGGLVIPDLVLIGLSGGGIEA